MVVQLKVLMNADEINSAKAKNDYYAKQRQSNEDKKAKEGRVLVPDDLEVPEQDIELKDWYIDIEDVKDARVNEIGMIEIFHLYRGERQIVNTPEVWEALQNRFK